MAHWWRGVQGLPCPSRNEGTTVVAHLSKDAKDGWIKFDEEMSHGELWDRAGAVASLLDVDKGDRVMLCFSPGMDFFIGFWACLRFGVVAVPVIPPSPSTMIKALTTMTRVATAADVHIGLTDDRITTLRRTTGLIYSWPRKIIWKSISDLSSAGRRRQQPREPWSWRSSSPRTPRRRRTLDDVGTEDLAFLQFTSGSTGDPKGVMVGHDNLWHNAADAILPFNRQGLHDDGDPKKLTMVSWLPPYHDLGLVYMHIAPLVHGDNMAYLSPLDFLRDPVQWVDLMTTSNATYSGGPDFGYKLCTRRFREAKEDRRRHVDLSACVWMMSAAERVRPATYTDFRTTFSNYGFNGIIAGAYGLAETVVGCCVSLDLRPSVQRPDLVCCGVPYFDDGGDGIHVKIVNSDEMREVEMGKVGEIWISSKSVCRGYWGRPELSSEVFRAQTLGDDDDKTWLRTGDEGFVEDGGLFICGRQKDMIIIDGANIFAEDVEATIVDHVSAEVVRPGAIAAFGDDDNDREGLVVVFEVRKKDDAPETTRDIGSVVLKHLGVRPTRVVAITPKTIPRTTSGKIRRRATRDALRSGALTILFDSHAERAKNTDPRRVRLSEATASSSSVCGGTDDTLSLLDEANNVKGEDDTDDTDDTDSKVEVFLESREVLDNNDKSTDAAYAKDTWLDDIEARVRALLLDDDDDGDIASSFATSNDAPPPPRKLVRSCSEAPAKLVRNSSEAQPPKLVRSSTTKLFRSRSTKAAIMVDDGRLTREEKKHRGIIAKVVVGSDEATVEGCLDRFEEDVVNAARLAYVEGVLVSKAREILDTSTRETCLAEGGMTSQDAARLQHAVVDALGVDVDLLVLLRPESPLGDVAAVILDTALGNGVDNEPPLAEVLPFNDPENQVVVSSSSSSGCLVYAVFIIMIAVVVSMALIPAYHFGLWVQWKEVTIGGKKVLVRRDNAPWSHVQVGENINGYGILVPLVIPIFMFALSVLTVLMKWIVIGRYRVVTVTTTGTFFLRWWLVDRLLDQYDMWSGVFIYDTILMNVFCLAMGANVAMTAKIKTLPREFDLITIGDHAVVSGMVYCRLFAPTKILRFERVVIGQRVDVTSSAIVMPGSKLDHGSVLDHGAATAPGMRLVENTIYRQSPARVHRRGVLPQGHSRRRRRRQNNKQDAPIRLLGMEMAKIMTLGWILYLTMITSNLTTVYVMRQVDFYEWSACRYRELLFYSVAFFTAMVMTGILCVLLKWLLTWRQLPGSRIPTDWSWKLRTWVVEWMWYRLMENVGWTCWEENGIVSIALMRALGAKVAWDTNVAYTFFFTPVEADLIEIKSGAVTSGFNASCEGADGVWKTITLDVKAQVGLRSRLHAGVVVGRGAVVGHQTIVPEDVMIKARRASFADRMFITPEKTKKSDDDDDDDEKKKNFNGIARYAIQPGLRLLNIVLLGFVALIPAYELGCLVFYGLLPNYCTSNFYNRGFEISNDDIHVWEPPVNRTLALLFVGPIGLVALASIALVFRVYQWLILGDFRTERRLKSRLFKLLYMEYQGTAFHVNAYIMALLRGTPLAVAYMRFFGADVSWSALINSTYFFEPALLDIGPDVVIDDRSTNVAHVYEHGRLVFRRKVIGTGAICHPGSVTWAGDVVPDGVILGPRGQLGNETSSYGPGTFLQGCPARDYTDLYLAARIHNDASDDASSSMTTPPI